jgi:hypothetical protein
MGNTASRDEVVRYILGAALRFPKHSGSDAPERDGVRSSLFIEEGNGSSIYDSG